MRTSGVPYCLRPCDTDAVERALDAFSGSDDSDSTSTSDSDRDMQSMILGACGALDGLPQCPSFVTCDDQALRDVDFIRQALGCDGDSDSDGGTTRLSRSP